MLFVYQAVRLTMELKELLLVEGLEMFGMGNWEQISEHIGTKTRLEVAEHYESVYENSDAWPLPVRFLDCILLLLEKFANTYTENGTQV